MRKLLFKILLITLLTAVLAIPTQAAIKKVAQTGLQFLKVDMSARAAAMGGAYMMVGDDATAMFYNPAGIGNITSNFDLFVNHTRWIADINYSAFGLVRNLGTWGALGFNAVICDYGDILGTRVNRDIEQGYDELGNLDVSAYAVGVTYAKALTNKFSVGATVKYASQRLGYNVLDDGTAKKNDVSGMVYDFGTIFYPGFKSLRLGMSVRNFSEEFEYEKESFELPLTFTIGFAMDVLDFMGEHENALTVSIDATHPRDYTERLHFGAEYMYMDMFALRAGYKYNYDLEGLTAGLGVNYELPSGVILKVDYSYCTADVFDGINRFSLGVSF